MYLTDKCLNLKEKYLFAIKSDYWYFSICELFVRFVLKMSRGYAKLRRPNDPEKYK